LASKSFRETYRLKKEVQILTQALGQGIELFYRRGQSCSIILALGEEADYEAVNFMPERNLIRTIKFHFSIEPAFSTDAC